MCLYVSIHTVQHIADLPHANPTSVRTDGESSLSSLSSTQPQLLRCSLSSPSSLSLIPQNYRTVILNPSSLPPPLPHHPTSHRLSPPVPQVILLDPQNTHAYRNRGLLLDKLGHFGTAINDFSKVSTMN